MPPLQYCLFDFLQLVLCAVQVVETSNIRRKYCLCDSTEETRQKCAQQGQANICATLWGEEVIFVGGRQESLLPGRFLEKARLAETETFAYLDCEASAKRVQ